MRKNLGLKIFSLLVAMLLFSFVNSEGNTTVVSLTIPVEIVSIPPGRIVLSPEHPQTQVTIRGPSSLVARLASSPPVFHVKVPPKAENGFVTTLDRDTLGLPPYFSVQRIEPSELEVRLDRLVQRELPVVVPRIGNLRPSLRLDEITVAPQNAHVRGPMTEIGNLTTIETYPLDLRDIEGSITRDVSLKVPGTMSEVTPKQVEVSVKISVIEREQRFEKLPLEVRAMPGQKYQVEPGEVSVVISGPDQRVETLRPEEIVPYVRVRESGATSEESQVQVDVPSQLHVISIEPQVARVIKIDGRLQKVPTTLRERKTAVREVAKHRTSKAATK